MKKHKRSIASGGPTTQGLARAAVVTPPDFRKDAKGLAPLVKAEMGADPFSGTIYVLRARRGPDQAGLLGGSGVCLVPKRLEDGEFHWLKMQDGAMRLTVAQFLFEGLDWKRVHAPIEVRVREPAGYPRQDKSRPIVDNLAPWLTEQLARIGQKTKLAEAIRQLYLLKTSVCALAQETYAMIWIGHYIFGRPPTDDQKNSIAFGPIYQGMRNLYASCPTNCIAGA